MTPENFCYFLQGYFEITKAVTGKIEVDPIAAKVIDDHLQLVFKKETSEYIQFGEIPQTGITTNHFKVPDIRDTGFMNLAVPHSMPNFDSSKVTC